MKRLMLLRHAKSMIADPGQSDRARSLSQRGLDDARAMARVLASHPPLPDLVLCSSARRTRETLAALLPHLAANTNIRISDTLYEGTGATYANLISQFGGAANVVLVIGHNPTIHATAASLAGHGPMNLRSRLSERYPAGSLSIIEFREGDWADLADGAGVLTTFLRPRDLPAGV